MSSPFFTCPKNIFSIYSLSTSTLPSPSVPCATLLKKLIFSLLFLLPPILNPHLDFYSIHTPSQLSYTTPRVEKIWDLSMSLTQCLWNPYRSRNHECTRGMTTLARGKTYDCWWKQRACLCQVIRLVCELSLLCIELFIGKCRTIKIILKPQNLPYSQKESFFTLDGSLPYI